MEESNEIDLDSFDHSKSGFETFLINNKLALSLLFIGAAMVGLGIFYVKNDFSLSSNKVEIVSDKDAVDTPTEIVVEIAGSVFKPGIYKLKANARIGELIELAGGISTDADKLWIEKNINRAAKLTDSQKLYIPGKDEQSDVLSAKDASNPKTGLSGETAEKEGIVNINSASLAELDSLPGIGQVYGQNIIDHRPYSSTEELLSKQVLKKNVFEKIKERITVF